MKKRISILIVLLVLFFGTKLSFAQLKTRLATNCAIENVQIPINIKNLENIKSFQLKILFDNSLLRLDTSYYHQTDFSLDPDEIYRIKVAASNDTITIKWAAYYGVNIQDDLLLSLVFSEIGNGNASFSWLEDECFYKNFDGLSIDAEYTVDADINIPYNNTVHITFEQFTIGCRDNSESGGCKAQAEVYIDGGVMPYQYRWGNNQNTSLVIGLCEDPISVVIRDAAECIYASLFDPIIYPAAVYEIKASPEIAYITKPVVEFSIETDDEYIETYLWDFGDEATANTENAMHPYAQVGNFMVSLRTENIDGCDTTVSMSFEVKELNFCIPNVFTPNGDGINDTWIFKIIGADGGGGNGGTSSNFKDTGLSDVKKCSGDDLVFAEHFKTSSLVVMNRNGRTIYECNNCVEYWDGGGLPDGVYFYVFTWEGEYSNGKEQGNVTIIGSQK